MLTPYKGKKKMKKLVYLFLVVTSNVFADYAFDLNGGLPLAISTDKFEKEVDPSITVGFAFRWLRDENISFGLNYHFVDFSKTDTRDNNLYAIARYDSSHSQEFMSYFAFAGLGLAHADFDGKKYQRLGSIIGAGLKNPLSETTFFSFQVDYLLIPSDSTDAPEQHILAPKVGFTWILPGEKSMLPPAQKLISDQDFDGVSDDNDKCANTPEGSTVNQFGCQVNEEIKIFVDVKFGLGSAKIDETYTVSLDSLAYTLKEHESVKVEIQGHSDNTGEASFNTILSQKRADAVRDYLVNIHSISFARIKSIGYGPKFPKHSNATREGREKNRRVVAKILLN